MLKKWLLYATLAGAIAAGETFQLSQDRMRADVKYLASDELEGRGVGTKGEKLATDYLAAQLRAGGCRTSGR